MALSIVLIGGGITGVWAGTILARAGYKVVVVEQTTPFSRQSSYLVGGQARYHSGLYLASSNLAVAQATRREYRLNHLAKHFPTALVEHVPVTYLVDAASAGQMREIWREAGFTSEPVHLEEPALKSQLAVCAFRTDPADGVIDAAALALAAEQKLLQAGAKLLRQAPVIGTVRKNRCIVSVLVRQNGQTLPIPADFVVNCAGAHLGIVSSLCDPAVPPTLGEKFSITATPVLRVPWIYKRQILQFQGVPEFLSNLSCIPVGRSYLISIATRGGQPVTDPDWLPDAATAVKEKDRLLGLFRKAFPSAHLPLPSRLNYCKKALLQPVGATDESSARLPTVDEGTRYGGEIENLAVASCGKLSNLSVGEAVLKVVNRHFGRKSQSAAA